MRPLPFALLAALAACSPAQDMENGSVKEGSAPPADVNEPEAATAVEDGAAADENAAAAGGEGDRAGAGETQGEAGQLPPADRELRFVGRWAANVSLCGDSAWRFTANKLTTPAGSVCRFGEVRKVAGGYDITARCTAESPERDDTLKLRFAESAQAMLFESESIADAGLVYCGE